MTFVTFDEGFPISITPILYIAVLLFNNLDNIMKKRRFWTSCSTCKNSCFLLLLDGLSVGWSADQVGPSFRQPQRSWKCTIALQAPFSLLYSNNTCRCSRKEPLGTGKVPEELNFVGIGLIFLWWEKSGKVSDQYFLLPVQN